MLGFLNINKQSGMSSAAVVAKLKKQFHLDKVGHMGTLDPMASGVLPIAVGKATRLFDYFLEKEKSYVAEFEFGYTTDTLDAMGVVTCRDMPIPTPKEVENILSSLTGEVDQIPPMYSAKNVQGRRAYDLARSGIIVELQPKRVTIKTIKLLQQISETKYQFLIVCSSGTYIRSIARDMGQLLGTGATMTALKRTNSGYFDIEQSMTLEELQKVELLEDVLVSPMQVFPQYKVVTISEQQQKDLCNGKTIAISQQNGLCWVVSQNKVVGLTKIVEQKAKIEVYLWEE